MFVWLLYSKYDVLPNPYSSLRHVVNIKATIIISLTTYGIGLTLVGSQLKILGTDAMSFQNEVHRSLVSSPQYTGTRRCITECYIFVICSLELLNV